jgi:SAM-dependent methyltransferase
MMGLICTHSAKPGEGFLRSAKELALTSADLERIFHLRFGEQETLGPLPRLWKRLHYYVPEIFYEAVVDKLVCKGSSWLDVGAGRHLLFANPALASLLSERSGLLVGVDPDEGILDNPYVHKKVQCTIDEFVSDVTFDVVTLRMVAEHITCPNAAVAALARLTKPGSKVVVFTVNRWSPVALAAWAVPFRFHYPLKRVLWGVPSEQGTFPVAYQMNTRSCLQRVFAAHGFRERSFAYLDDCRTFYRVSLLHFLELMVWLALRAVGVTYPENCLLGVYERC